MALPAAHEALVDRWSKANTGSRSQVSTAPPPSTDLSTNKPAYAAYLVADEVLIRVIAANCRRILAVKAL